MSVPKQAPADHVIISPGAARGGVNTGLIWILGISMLLAVVFLLGYWLLSARHFEGAAGSRGQPTTTGPAADRPLRPLMERMPATAPAPTRLDQRRQAEAARL